VLNADSLATPALALQSRTAPTLVLRRRTEP
jgi:hypothetical protein